MAVKGLNIYTWSDEYQTMKTQVRRSI